MVGVVLAVVVAHGGGGGVAVAEMGAELVVEGGHDGKLASVGQAQTPRPMLTLRVLFGIVFAPCLNWRSRNG